MSKHYAIRCTFGDDDRLTIDLDGNVEGDLDAAIGDLEAVIISKGASEWHTLVLGVLRAIRKGRP